MVLKGQRQAERQTLCGSGLEWFVGSLVGELDGLQTAREIDEVVQWPYQVPSAFVDLILIALLADRIAKESVLRGLNCVLITDGKT